MVKKWTTLKRVEIYNPATRRWTKESDMRRPRGWISTSSVKARIYAIGGSPRYMDGVWDAVPLSTVEELDTGFAVNAKGKLTTPWGEVKATN